MDPDQNPASVGPSPGEDAPPAAPSPRRRADPRLVLAAAGMLLFLAVLVDVLADGFLSATVDPIVHDALVLDGGPLRQAVAVLTVLGSVVFMLPLGFLAMLLVLRRQRLTRALVASTAAGFGVGLVYVFKAIVARQRPDLSEHLTSFPSGHAANSLIIWGLVLVVAVSWPPRRADALTGRWWADARPAVLTAVVAGLMGLTRLFLGVHWATDVLAGWAFGLGWLAFSVFLVDRAELAWGPRFERLRTS